MQLQAGDTLTVSQLLYGLLIPSGSDGANALARHAAASSPAAMTRSPVTASSTR